jgi:tetratricopeptide (TPR) repeat protein
MRKSHIYLGLCLLILLATLSCSKQKDTEVRYNMERAFFSAEKLKDRLMVNPQAARSEDFTKVVGGYRKVIEMLPTSMTDVNQHRQATLLAGSSQLRIADICLLWHNPSQAITELKKVLSDYPENSSQTSLALYKMAQIYQGMGNWDKALENYHLLLDPEKYPPLITQDKPNLELLSIPLNLVLISQGKKESQLEFENARNYYQKIIRDYPNSLIGSAAKLNLAKTYEINANWKEAIGVLETIKDSSGAVPTSILLEIGDIYLLKGKDIDNAQLTFEKAISIHPNDTLTAQALLKLGHIYYEQKNYPKSRDILSSISKQFPKQGYVIAQAQYLIAQSYENEGSWDRAINEFEWITTNFPTAVQALEVPLHIAIYYQQHDNPKIAQTFYDKALEQYGELIRKYPKTQLELLAMKYTARCYTLQNKWEEAVKTLQGVSDKYPQTSEAFEALLTQATIYEQKLNQKEKAKETYSRILSGFPNHPSTAEIEKKMKSL